MIPMYMHLESPAAMNQISNVSNVNLTLRPGVPTQVRGRQAVSFHYPLNLSHYVFLLDILCKVT